MKIQLTTLGLIGMAGAPFLFAEMYALQGQSRNTSVSGVCDLIYMIGWSCTIIALLRLEATGSNRSGKMILYIQLALLAIANGWNLWTIVDPGNDSMLYFILDFSWPASNICLLIVGIIIAVKGKLKGWIRYSVLTAGLWLPISILLMVSLGQGNASLILSGAYSAITWFIMAFMIYKNGSQWENRIPAYQFK